HCSHLYSFPTRRSSDLASLKCNQFLFNTCRSSCACARSTLAKQRKKPAAIPILLIFLLLIVLFIIIMSKLFPGGPLWPLVTHFQIESFEYHHQSNPSEQGKRYIRAN